MFFFFDIYVFICLLLYSMNNVIGKQNHFHKPQTFATLIASFYNWSSATTMLNIQYQISYIIISKTILIIQYDYKLSTNVWYANKTGKALWMIINLVWPKHIFLDCTLTTNWRDVIHKQGESKQIFQQSICKTISIKQFKWE